KVTAGHAPEHAAGRDRAAKRRLAGCIRDRSVEERHEGEGDDQEDAGNDQGGLEVREVWSLAQSGRLKEPGKLAVNDTRKGRCGDREEDGETGEQDEVAPVHSKGFVEQIADLEGTQP